MVRRPFWGNVRSFAQYKTIMEETAGLARSIHGKMHSVRTVIAAQMMANFYQVAKGIPIAQERHLLMLTAAAHDAQRKRK